MDFNDALKEFGKKKALKVIFGDLNGIDFGKVEIVDYKSIYHLIDNFESHADNWVFTNDNSISLFYISTITSTNIKLKQLKLLNHLKSNENWYYGNGFRINQSPITKDLAALRITSSDILLSSFPDNSEGDKKNNGIILNWIKGVYGIVDANSIPVEKKKISNYSYEALWFDGKPEHIIIHSLETSQAYELISQIIEVNGVNRFLKKLTL